MIIKHNKSEKWQGIDRSIEIKVNNFTMQGQLCIPKNAKSLIFFVHGSGSSKHTCRNKYLANFLNQSGFATLLFELLIEQKEIIDLKNGVMSFNIALLAERVIKATKWLNVEHQETAQMPIGYFASSTGAAAALVAAANLPGLVNAIVSRGGRPDLANSALQQVKSPVLLIAGEKDPLAVTLNEKALDLLTAKKGIALVPNATNLFEEPGTLDIVAELAHDWFENFL